MQVFFFSPNQIFYRTKSNKKEEMEKMNKKQNQTAAVAASPPEGRQEQTVWEWEGERLRVSVAKVTLTVKEPQNNSFCTQVYHENNLLSSSWAASLDPQGKMTHFNRPTYFVQNVVIRSQISQRCLTLINFQISDCSIKVKYSPLFQLDAHYFIITYDLRLMMMKGTNLVWPC